MISSSLIGFAAPVVSVSLNAESLITRRSFRCLARMTRPTARYSPKIKHISEPSNASQSLRSGFKYRAPVKTNDVKERSFFLMPFCPVVRMS